MPAIDLFEGFRSRFEAALKYHRISLRQWCMECGVPYSTINTAYKRKTLPKVDILLKICNYFGMSLDYLVSGSEPESISAAAMKRARKGIFIEGRPVSNKTQLYKIVQALSKVREDDIARYRVLLMLSEANTGFINWISRKWALDLEGDGAISFTQKSKAR